MIDTIKWLALVATTIGLATIAPSGCATAARPPPAQSENVSLERSRAFIVHSSQTGRAYRIFVAEPRGEPPPEGWPVIYTLDADIMFATMVETARSYERREHGFAALIVGIGYPPNLDPGAERRIDYTGSRTAQRPPESGGAEDFLAFIRTQLMPRIASQAHIDRSRETIFGHSFGGHFVLYALLNDPTLFDNYVAASPSIWFDDRLLIQPRLRDRLLAKLEDTGAAPHALLTAGQYEEDADPDFAPRSLEDLRARGQVANAQAYARWLREEAGVPTEFRLITGEDHGTVIPSAIGRAIRFAAAAPHRRTPSRRPRTTFLPATSIEVPSSAQYTTMSAEDRFALRLRVRALPPEVRDAWNLELRNRLDSALTYRQHRTLHEEREMMDQLHGAAEPRISAE